MLDVQGKLVQITDEVSNGKFEVVAKGVCADARRAYNNLDLNVSLADGKRYEFLHVTERSSDSASGYIQNGCGRVRSLEVIKESVAAQES